MFQVCVVLVDGYYSRSTYQIDAGACQTASSLHSGRLTAAGGHRKHVAVVAAAVAGGAAAADVAAGQGVASAPVALYHGAGPGNTGLNGEATAAADAGSDWHLDAGRRTAVGRDEGPDLGDGAVVGAVVAGAVAVAVVVAAVAAGVGEIEGNLGQRSTASPDEAGRWNRRRDYWDSLLLLVFFRAILY